MSRRAFVLVIATAACGGSTDSKDAMIDDGFDRSALLAHLSRDVLLPMQTAFAPQASQLPAAIDAYCDALDAGTPGTTLEAARAVFGKTVDAWELNDAVLVGPAEMNSATLRGKIYGWPNSSPCEVDKDVASRWANPGSYNADAELVGSRSLLAIELLLYPPMATAHNCFNPPPGWDALGADLPRARCRLAEAIAIDVAAQAVTLETAWRADGGGYVDELANAGKSGSTLTSAHGALNLISDSMFYVDQMVKDMKIAESAQISVSACVNNEPVCDREIELRYSDRGTFAIRANLAALRQTFTGDVGGTTGLGFDDWLVMAGHPDLAARMTMNLDASIQAAAALPDSWYSALYNNKPAVVSTHAAIKSFCDDLKSQFLTVLALEIPDDVAADND